MTTVPEIAMPNLSASERDRLFSAIGSVVVNFQQVELWLAEVLASVLSMRVLEDRHIISSAMSFRQKVDLVTEIYPRKKVHYHGVEMQLIKKSLYAEEEFRNRIVHSLWTVENPGKWVRVKSSIKGRKGFALSTSVVNVEELEAAAAVLLTIREWELIDTTTLQGAIDTLLAQHVDA